MLEIERSVEIVNKLAEAIPDFVSHIKNKEDYNRKIIKGEILDIVDGGKVKTGEEIIDDWTKAYEKVGEQIAQEKGDLIAEIEFEDALFNTFFQFCGNKRWGAKQWFQDVPLYLEFLQDLNKANQQPKDR